MKAHYQANKAKVLAWYQKKQQEQAKQEPAKQEQARDAADEAPQKILRQANADRQKAPCQTSQHRSKEQMRAHYLANKAKVLAWYQARKEDADASACEETP